MALATLITLLSWGLLVRSAEIAIDYENNTFTKDGRPYQYISGSIHYFRIPERYWQDRLEKVAAAGLNAITTYAPWNYHHTSYNTFDFEGSKDVFKFLDIAQSNGLDVIFRGLPYSCGEYTFGGIPPWILTAHPNVTLRRSDPIFMGYVKRWFSVFLPKIKPYLAHYGGPIITVQVENEYGSWPACDKDYMKQLASLLSSYLGPEALLFTTDGDGQGYLKCGAIDEAYATVDFGPGFSTDVFKPQRLYEPHGPLVNSEYYVGWLDHWGQRHSTSSTDSDVKYLLKLLKMKANVNMYMFHGGTNFGFMNGANFPSYLPQPTSYDYDSPISEAGDITAKYVAIAKAVRQFRGLPPITFPKNTTKHAYGKMTMESLGTLTSLLPYLTAPQGPVSSVFPLTMEELGFYEGLILYRTHILQDFPSNASLNVTVHDRGYVSLNGVPQGILSRMKPTCQSLNVSQAKSGDILDILVENQGRINFGYGMKEDFKGVVSNVTLNGLVLTKWTIYPLDFGQVAKYPYLLRHLPREKGPQFKRNLAIKVPFSPARIFVGQVPTLRSSKGPVMPDSFVDPTAWGKGLLFLNDLNLGRYWPSTGPQVTLYAPGPYFRSGPVGNVILMVELEQVPEDFTLSLVDTPDLSGHLGNINKESQWRQPK